MASPTVTDRVEIAFAGRRSGQGPLTLGQRNTWQWIQAVPDDPLTMLEWILPVPDGAAVADVVATFAILLARHESLRTTFAEIDGELRQRVHGAGTLVARIHRAERVEDSRTTARMMIAELRGKPFEIATELPIRLAVAAVGERAFAAAAVYSHMAVDYGSLAVLNREFTELVGDPGQRSVGPQRHQPLDQAAEENSPRGRRRADAALRYWTEHLRRTPQCLMALPPIENEDDGPAAAALRSPAAALALDHLTSRLRVTPAAAILAALCAVVSIRVDQSRCVFASLSSNRFTPRLRDYVGTLAQDGLVVVEVTGPSFDDLVRHTGAALLRANRHSLFDVAELVASATRINHAQGTDFSRDSVFNYIGAHLILDDSEVTNTMLRYLHQPDLRWSPPGAAGESTITWTPTELFPNRIMVQLVSARPALLVGISTGDTRHVPRNEIIRLLRGMERVLLAAATGPVELDRLPEISGLAPIERDRDWVRVGPSWVQLSQVRELLRDALSTPACVFGGADPNGADPNGTDPNGASAGGGTLVTAHLAATAAIRTPQQAHAACLARLRGRYAVTAPHHYVLHEAAPADPSDLAAWLSLPVLAAGDGRASVAGGDR
nr:condensation domain-containing protein [Micromonospora sp. DSM 115978]